MEMPIHSCSFQGGMNKDISPNEYLNTCYFDAENLRLIVDESAGMSSADLTTPKGNISSFTLPTSTYLLGHVVLRDALIILAKDITVGLSKPDKIYRIDLSSLIPYSTSYTVSNLRYDTGNLIYEEDLGFDLNYPIRVVANYENADIQKIYWVDSINTLKHLNIIQNDNFNDLASLDPNLLEIAPNNSYGTYELSESIGGHLKAGRIQYSYQLYSVSGTETMFAPPSNLYNLTSSSISDGIDFTGSEIETEINKTIQIVITLPDGTSSTFNRIRLVALTYEEYNDVPTVRIVSEQELSSNVVILNDSGNSIGEIVLEEFQAIKNDLVPTTIETKNNYLFAANLQEQFFDVDELVKDLLLDDDAFLDTRAYRWRNAAAGTTGTAFQLLSNLTDPRAGFDPAEHPVGVRCYEPITLHQFDDAGFDIEFEIGAEDYAFNTLGASAFGGVSSIKWDSITLSIWDTVDWHQMVQCVIDSFTYTSDGNNITGNIRAYGTSYGLGSLLPSEVINRDDIVIISAYFIFSYTTILAGATVLECTVNKGFTNGMELVIDDGSGIPDYDIPEDRDCINTYNNIVNDENDNHGYKYKFDSASPPTAADLGGTGPYISYEFVVPTTSLDIGESDTITWPDATPRSNKILYGKLTSAGYKDSQNVVDYTSHQRDEVYRYGITFYDLKGRPSFAKWIGDIRFPSHSDYELTPSTSDTIMKADPLGIKFTIDWNEIDADYPGLLENLSGFQFIRLPRTENDCTIKAQGLIVPTHHPTVAAGDLEDADYSSCNVTSAYDYTNGITQIAGITGANSSITKDLVELISPEIAVNKSLNINKDTDFLEIFGRLDYVVSTGAGEVNYVLDGSNYHYGIYSVSSTCVAPYDSTSTLIATDWRRDIEEAIISTPEKRSGTLHVLDGTAYKARGFNDEVWGDDPMFSFKGTSLVAKIDSAFTSTDTNCGIYGTVGASGTEEAMYGRYRRYLGYSIYGGATYNERTYNNYIKAGDFSEIPDPATTPTESYDVYNGDVYICPFNFLKLFSDIDGEVEHNTSQVVVSFPIESKINISCFLTSTEEILTNSSSSWGTSGVFFISEKQSLGVSNFPNGYPECGDLYRYNSAYSAQDISKLYPIKPFDFRSEEEKDVLIASSEPKINGEYVDSWLKFKFNNYIELEGEYGAITKLINNNDKLIAFQPRGIAVLSVAERELIQTNNTAALAVGDGGILSRYDYLSRTIGASLYDAICSTELGTYFYSDKLHSIYRIGESIESLSDTKGMKSYFETSPWTECLTTYDRDNREVLFTGKTGSTSYNTLVFSGYTDTFIGFFTFGEVDKYIAFDKYLISSLDGNSFYLHNSGDYNSYYDTYQTSTLSVIANPGKTNVATFHILEWITDLTWASNGVELPNYTFDALQITDTYQDTDLIELSKSSYLKKRFRKWRLNNFRDDTKGRFRDSWIKATFTWHQSYPTKKLIIHPINFMYLPTKLW